MRLLLLHPADSLGRGPWAVEAWDRVIDLGTAGPDFYRTWSQKLNCPVTPVDSPSRDMKEFRWLRDVLVPGYDSLLDRQNLDWWELNAVFLEEQLMAVASMERLLSSLSREDRISVSRQCFHGNVLSLLLGKPVHAFSTKTSPRSRLHHYLQVVRKFPFSQLVEIFWDKYDPVYKFRGHFQRHQEAQHVPVILLPSSYVNVSRTAIAYADTLREESFLLVATRQSGLNVVPPGNVGVAKLASYSSDRSETSQEYGDLLARWGSLRRNLESIPEFAILAQSGALDRFPSLMRQGLGIRDAWLKVFEREPVKAVLCADDYNPYTRIPLLLARNRGLPAIACHHGALDGRCLFKPNHAHIILAKGRMEQDYLLRVCGLPPEQVEVGAPASPLVVSESGAVSRPASATSIIFFSECYEAAGARGEEFYREILPPLAALALRTDRKLIIKLHPFESQHERKNIVTRILSAEERRCATVVSGPLTGEFLTGAWFGVTVLSTVALDCALAGRLCFLCRWLDYGRHGYQEQLSRFGAGYPLESAEEIAHIPDILENHSADPHVLNDLWQPISAATLRSLFSGQWKLSRCAS